MFALGGLFSKKDKQMSESTNTYEEVRQNINEIFSNSTKTTIQSANNSNMLNIQIKKMKAGCPLDMSQKISSSQIEIAEVNSDLSNKLTEKIGNQLKQAAESNLEKKTDLIGSMAGLLGGGTDQEVINNVTTKIADITKDTFSVENLQKVSQQVTNANKAKIKIGVCDGPINIKQDLMNLQMSKSLEDTLISKLKDSKIDMAVETSASGNVMQEDTTVSSITDLIGNITTGYSAMIMCCVCAAVCLCVGLLVFMMSPAGQNVARQTNLSSFRPL
jgi:predicted house-cleaning noncanonical NTP pyrophosphatase (MazG superfamily)